MESAEHQNIPGDPLGASRERPQNPDVVLDLSSKTITTSFQNLKNASLLSQYFMPSLIMGALNESEIDWGRLIDEMGYAEMLAAKQTLKDLGMVQQLDALGSPGGISLQQTFDLDKMILDLEKNFG